MSQIGQKLDKIKSVISIDKILQRDSADIKNIAKYYRKNRLAYKLFNSKEGFVHMGISSDGTFSEKDYYAQANIISTYIDGPTKNILELAAGKAATTNHLANKFPSKTFYCIDLPGGQFTLRNKPSNVRAEYGDYHNLSSYEDSSMDFVYVIEALCHAADKNTVIKEVQRVLKPGGYFVVIDGYYTSATGKLPTDDLTAIKLVAKSMMVVDNDQSYERFRKLILANGFSVEKAENYSKHIMPSLKRLEGLAKRFFRLQWRAKLLNFFLSDLVTANAAAAYVMPYCVENGLLEYRFTACKKQ